MAPKDFKVIKSKAAFYTKSKGFPKGCFSKWVRMAAINYVPPQFRRTKGK